MIQISLYNTLSKKNEIFTPLTGNSVKLYVCGITPYDASHLGHAFVFVIFDTLKRFLKHLGYAVTYVQNITDVDDDILKKARETGKNWQELGDRWVDILKKDFAYLNILLPDHMPKASETIDTIIDIIRTLQKNEHAYEVDGWVYFAASSFEKYGALSRLNEHEMIRISAERGADPTDRRKKNRLDFVLWQRSRPDEPSWGSPWGRGRPGWHIECSAMIHKLLGNHIDIHGGGSDLIFPHHESEIAQSESYTGISPFAKCWMHIAMVYQGDEKMSKSLGNLVFISNLAKKYSGNAIRWYLLSHHYRKKWKYHEDDLEVSNNLVNKIQSGLPSHLNNPSSTLYPPSSFMAALATDFNTPLALQIIANETDPEKRRMMWDLLGFTS